MRNLFDINIPRLFVLTLVFKVISSGIGWFFHMPWLFGLFIPMALMSAYIFIGIKRNTKDVSDEKFADSCYYLGFIFTITSIIFSLFDLPNIGTQIQDIGVRFGAAMASTLLGLSVRVYLISFGKEVADAIKDAEDGIIEASHRFQLQLINVLDKLRDFEARVDDASKGTVERVSLQIEALSKNHSEKLTDFFGELTTKNQDAFTLALAEVRNASQGLAQSVDKYSAGMKDNLVSIEEKVGNFTDAIGARLNSTTFPDDYFSSRLSGPLSDLADSAHTLSKNVMMNAESVGNSNDILVGSLKKMTRSATSAEKSLETVIALATQQETILATSEGQLNSLSYVSKTLEKVDSSLVQTLAGLHSNHEVSSGLSRKITDLLVEETQTRVDLASSLSSVAERLSESISATVGLGAKIEKSTSTAESVVFKLNDSVSNTTTIVNSVSHLAENERNNAERLRNLNDGALVLFENSSQVSEYVKAILAHLNNLDGVMKIQSEELRAISNGISQLVQTSVAIPKSDIVGIELTTSSVIGSSPTVYNSSSGQ